MNIYPVDKFPGSINAGIDKIKEMELFVTERSYHIIEELRKYVWDKDKDLTLYHSPVDVESLHRPDKVLYLGAYTWTYFKPKDLTGIFTH